MVAKAKLEPGFTGNLFLDSLSSLSAARLVPRLEPFDGVLGAVVAHAGKPIRHVVFPIAGVVSAVTRM